MKGYRQELEYILRHAQGRSEILYALATNRRQGKSEQHLLGIARDMVRKQVRNKVFADGLGYCACCGANAHDGAKMHVDHIIPGAQYAPENLQLLCSDCNEGKGSWNTIDWRPLQ